MYLFFQEFNGQVPFACPSAADRIAEGQHAVELGDLATRLWALLCREDRAKCREPFLQHTARRQEARDPPEDGI